MRDDQAIEVESTELLRTLIRRELSRLVGEVLHGGKHARKHLSPHRPVGPSDLDRHGHDVQRHRGRLMHSPQRLKTIGASRFQFRSDMVGRQRLHDLASRRESFGR